MRDRLGDEAAERLVDPLVGGINAGDTDQLSLAATVPQLDAAAPQRPPVAHPGVPGAAGGGHRPERAGVLRAEGRHGRAGRRPWSTTSSAAGVSVLADAAPGLDRDGSGWQVQPRPAGRPWPPTASSSPSRRRPAAELVRPHAAPHRDPPRRRSPTRPWRLVSLAVPRDAIDRELDGSGFLVPRVEGRTITACSWTSAKWPHLAGDGTTWLRASVGRDGADAALGLPDAALVDAVLADLADTMALRGPPTEVRVTRWPASFPQYRPGHLERVDAIDADLAAAAPGVVVAGAALRGLGIPACIRQAAAAVARLLAALDEP